MIMLSRGLGQEKRQKRMRCVWENKSQDDICLFGLPKQSAARSVELRSSRYKVMVKAAQRLTVEPQAILGNVDDRFPTPPAFQREEFWLGRWDQTL